MGHSLLAAHWSVRATSDSSTSTFTAPLMSWLLTSHCPEQSHGQVQLQSGREVHSLRSEGRHSEYLLAHNADCHEQAIGFLHGFTKNSSWCGSVLMTWQLASSRASDLRENNAEAIVLFITSSQKPETSVSGVWLLGGESHLGGWLT